MAAVEGRGRGRQGLERTEPALVEVGIFWSRFDRSQRRTECCCRGQGIACILVHEPKKSFIRKFLYEPFPVESSLRAVLHNHFNAEIAGGAVKSKQDAVRQRWGRKLKSSLGGRREAVSNFRGVLQKFGRVDQRAIGQAQRCCMPWQVEYLTWTFFFRRLVMNPTYYHLDDVAPAAIQVLF
jgi:hypothetical protein